jgi:cystathionine beta-synthase
VIDKFMKVTDRKAHGERNYKKEGLFVGYTSGAVFQTMQYAEEGV